MTELAAARADDGTWVFDVVTAAASIPVKPPASWFSDPGLEEATALTVTADGRVYGHACTWFSRHVGLPGHVTPPRSKSGYREYLSGEVETDDGAMVATGRITLGGGHAGLGGDIVAAQQHYDDVSFAVADVQCGEDQVGLWFAGALRPDVTPEQIRALRASSVSGDWRSIDGNMALCAVHAVNVPGFSTPRANVAASGALTSLVAAGMVARRPAPTPQESRMPEQTSDADTPESLVAATPGFAKGEPSPPDDEPEGDGEGFESGDSVLLDDLDVVAQVVSDDGEGGVTIEVTVPASMLERADDETAMAASARFTDRMADRKRDADMARLTKLTASLAETMTSQSAQVDQLLAESRSTRATEALRAAGLDA